MTRSSKLDAAEQL